MTPLQAHAAAICVTPGTTAISAFRMDAVMQIYSGNRFSALIGPEISAIIDSINADMVLTDEEKAALIADINSALPPVASNTADLSYTFLNNSLSKAPGTTFDTGALPPPSLAELSTRSLSQIITDYCNFVLCKGDVGRFSQVIDKISGFSASTGEVYETIQRAQSMQFADFGPGVANFGDVINMGMGKVLAPIAAAMRTAAGSDAGKLAPAGQAPTDNVIVSTGLAAQGDVSGKPGTPNYGTALGIYAEAKNRGLILDINNIHRAMVLAVGVPVTAVVPKVPLEYIIIPKNTKFTTDDVLRLLDGARNRAALDANSTNAQIKFYSEELTKWASDTSAARIKSFIDSAKTQAIDIFEREDTDLLTPYEQATLDATLRSENSMRAAIDGLTKRQAQDLFNKLGARVQVSRLARNTDILDLSKAALALPAQAPVEDTNPPIPFEDVYQPAMDDESATVQAISDPTAGLEFDAQGNVIAPSLTSQAGTALSNLGTQLVNEATSIGNALVTDVTNVGNALVADTRAIADRASTAVTNLADNISNAPAKAAELGSKLGEIKGFANVAGGAALSGLARGIETQFPVAGVGGTGAVAPDLLSSITQVMPANVAAVFSSIVGTGSSDTGGYRMNDFLGSVVALNQQNTRWAQITTLLNKLADEQGASLQSQLSLAADFDETIIVLQNFWALYGDEIESVYAATMTQFNSEWLRLTTKAEVNYNQLTAGSINSGIGFAKKLAQHANKLDSGIAEIVQLAADPTVQGGQILLGVMVEARNIKLLQSIGLNPVNTVEKKAVPAKVLDADKARAQEIQRASGNPDSVTAEEVAKARSVNVSLGG